MELFGEGGEFGFEAVLHFFFEFAPELACECFCERKLVAAFGAGDGVGRSVFHDVLYIMKNGLRMLLDVAGCRGGDGFLEELLEGGEGCLSSGGKVA